MIDVLKALFENIIDTLVIGCLCVLCVILAFLAVVSFPVKKVRVWLGKQIMKIADTMDYYLDESGKDG